MIHAYDNPNTCYAIGDSFALYLGTATTNRQPSAGVTEEVSSLVKGGTTDSIGLYDGTNFVVAITATKVTNLDQQDTVACRYMAENAAQKINNSVYFRKAGTTDRVAITGVQIDA